MDFVLSAMDFEVSARKGSQRSDFGVAKFLTKGTIVTSQTNSSAKSIGTPGFQPPEQLQAGVITESADVYALGCVFIELFSGSKIWQGLSAL